MFLLVYSTMDEINISRHFIERFNQRYMKSDVKWDILDLKMYLTKIFTPSQLRRDETKELLQRPIHLDGEGLLCDCQEQ